MSEVEEKINAIYLSIVRLESKIQDLEIRLRKLDEKERDGFLSASDYCDRKFKEAKKEEAAESGWAYD